MLDFLFLKISDNKKNKSSKTNLFYIKNVNSNDVNLIISFDNFGI